MFFGEDLMEITLTLTLTLLKITKEAYQFSLTIRFYLHISLNGDTFLKIEKLSSGKKFFKKISSAK